MRTKTSAFRSLIVSTLILVSGSVACATEPQPAGKPKPSRELREKLATVHEHLAACLRSDKPIADCRQEAMTSCQDMMGKQGCPMTGVDMGRGAHTEPLTTDEQRHK